MSIHNDFTQFSKGLLNGFGFGVGAGLVNMANRLIFGSRCSFPPLFGFGFGPCCMSTPLIPYFTPMPNFTLPSYNNSIFQNFSSLPTLPTPTLPDLPTLPAFDSTPVNPLNMGFQFPTINVPDFKSVDIFERSTDKKKTPLGGTVANGTHIYSRLTKADALARAKKDPNLEELTSGQGWEISAKDFINDIPFAKKGTGALLSKVCQQAGVGLVITSALGTKKSPHQADAGSASHYNEKNPKLDIGGGLSKGDAEELAKKLMNTGLFIFANPEDNKDGTGHWHLDLQFKDSAYETV